MRCVILCVLLALGPVACGGSEPQVVSAVAGLPEYTPTEASVFGDTLSATAFGLPAEVPVDQDTKLGERARHADAIVPVKVSTVTRESLAGVRGYVLTLVADGKALYGSDPPGPIDMRVGPGNPSLSQLQTADTALIGKRFLLFLRRYSDGGDATLHFHGEGDAPEVRKAIENARVLDSLSVQSKTGKK